MLFVMLLIQPGFEVLLPQIVLYIVVIQNFGLLLYLFVFDDLWLDVAHRSLVDFVVSVLGDGFSY